MSASPDAQIETSSPDASDAAQATSSQDAGPDGGPGPGAIEKTAQFDGAGDDVFPAIASTSSGFVAAFDFEGMQTIGSKQLTSAGKSDVVVFAMDADLNPTWAQRFGGAESDRGVYVATTPTGDVVVAFFAEGNITVAGELFTTTPPIASTIVVRLSGADGSPIWKKQLKANMNTVPFSLAIDDTGAVIVAGATATGGLDTGAAIDSGAPAGGFDGYVVSFAGADGAAKWARRGGGVAGDVTLEGVVRKGFGGRDAFIGKWTSSGTLHHARVLGGSLEDEAFGVAVRPDGRAAVIGTFNGIATFGDPLTSLGERDVFVVRLAP